MDNKQHPCPAFPHFIHGADDNPEQWINHKDTWDKDMELMKLANCNEMSVGIFSWSMLEPREGEFDFSFLDEIIEKIHANGGKVILATPSGARPHWMADKYPEVLRVNAYGQRYGFGARHNHCFSSPVFRQKVRTINTLLAERYGSHPAVIAWHISNEYSGECHCNFCKQAFRDFLKEKFGGDIQNLNKAYWTTFWSHTYDSFEQIDPPGPMTENGLHGLNLDWRRFVTHQTMDFIKNEIQPIKQITPHLPVTTNMMYEFYDLDYHKVAKILDFASWDSYPEWHNGDDAHIAQRAAFWHDLYRSLKNQPFLLMESTPSNVNWKPYNKPKRPGMDVLSSIQAIAHGSDSVQYFQWRKIRGASEKFHGAVIGHDGTSETRVFRAVQKTGTILQKIDQIAGTRTQAKAAVVFSWENMWALDDCQGYANTNKKYFDTCYEYHRVFWERGIDCDVISPHADLSSYEIVVAPMLYLADDETVENLKAYVHNGGLLYATYMLGTVDENDLCYLGGIPGSGLQDVFGITAEEIDVLYPAERQHLVLNGQEYELQDYCEIIKSNGATPIAVYSDGWYQGLPAVTSNRYGKGTAVYQACRDSGKAKDAIIGILLRERNITGNLDSNSPLPHGVSSHSRSDGKQRYVFVENYSGKATEEIKLKTPMESMLTGQTQDRLILPPYGFDIFKSI